MGALFHGAESIRTQFLAITTWAFQVSNTYRLQIYLNKRERAITYSISTSLIKWIKKKILSHRAMFYLQIGNRHDFLLAGLLGRELTAQGAATLWAHLAPKPRPRTTLERLIECGMGDVVNLRRARKKAEWQLAERTASANRLLYGRSKAERDLQAKRDVQARRE